MPKRRTYNYGDQIARTRKAHERLGTDSPACAVCGEDRAVILEKHHIVGQAYDPATMILCKNHHGLMTDLQKNFPPGVSDPPDKLECIGRMLLNLSELFAILVEKLKEFGLYLIDLAKSESDGSDDQL